MFLNNVAYNQQAQAITFAFRGTEGLIHVPHDLMGNTAAIITNNDAHIRIIIIRVDEDTTLSLTGNRLEGIANQIIEGLEKLTTIRTQLR